MNQAQKNAEIKKAKRRIAMGKAKVALLIIMTLAAFVGTFLAMPYTKDIRRVWSIVNTCRITSYNVCYTKLLRIEHFMLVFFGLFKFQVINC